MVTKLYLDGCSLTRGQGLESHECLAHLFEKFDNYQVTNQSRNGKSNMSIALDAYQHCQDHEVFVLGFTYSTRFGIKYQNHNLDFFPGFHGGGLGLPPVTNAKEIETEFAKIHKYFYTVFEPPFCDDLSDMIIDGIVSYLRSQNKKVIVFSWEPRKATVDILYPYIGPDSRLADGHLNARGTQLLFELLQQKINE